VAAAGSGQAITVSRELLLMGPRGVDATRLFAQLLDYAGYRDEAAEVAGLLGRPQSLD
jgi:hypothetical protein